MNVLITGVNGFIGQHLSRLLATKHNIYGVARTLVSARAQTAIKLIYADFLNPDFFDLLPRDIDCVIHLAQSQQYRDFPGGADDMRRINIDATCNLLEWARKTGVKQFVFTSTANVYGNSAELLTELHATKPDSFYGASKLAAEHLARQYQTYFQVDILRLFTVYGPGQKGMLIPNIIERITTGKPVTLAKGKGLYLTPIYIDDVVAVIDSLIDISSGSVVRLFNVCGDKVSSLADIVGVLESAVGIKAHIEFINADVPCFLGANNALKYCLGGAEFTSLENGLEITFNDYSTGRRA